MPQPSDQGRNARRQGESEAIALRRLAPSTTDVTARYICLRNDWALVRRMLDIEGDNDSSVDLVAIQRYAIERDATHAEVEKLTKELSDRDAEYHRLNAAQAQHVVKLTKERDDLKAALSIQDRALAELTACDDLAKKMSAVSDGITVAKDAALVNALADVERLRAELAESHTTIADLIETAEATLVDVAREETTHYIGAQLGDIRTAPLAVAVKDARETLTSQRRLATGVEPTKPPREDGERR